MSIQYGRLESANQKVINDTPSVKVAAMLSKQDEIIDTLAALTAKMDADFADVTNASVDYAASITDGLTKIDIID